MFRLLKKLLLQKAHGLFNAYEDNQILRFPKYLNMESANKILEMHMELALKQAKEEEGPNSLINISVKGTDNIPGYILRLVFGKSNIVPRLKLA